MILLCSGFLYYTYHSRISGSKEVEVERLKAISNSVAAQIDGDLHAVLLSSYGAKDEIKTVDESPLYESVHRLLKAAKAANELETDIYTMVLDRKLNKFQFGVSSSPSPYFRHVWDESTKLHHDNYETGGVLGPYTDENGTWLSSFTPIRDKHGQTVALLQVDEPFDSYIHEANERVFFTLIIMFFILLIVVYSMLLAVQQFLRKEDKVKHTLQRQRNEIESRNREILSSIRRAKSIQDALLPTKETLKRIFPEMFVMFEPRDIVSGDFFWCAEKDDAVYFALADCTGHGVPGGFMSMIGHTVLNNVVQRSDANRPSEILHLLDEELTGLLRATGGSSADGMDIALIRYHRATGVLEFSGAQRPFVSISDGVFTKIPGDKCPIGGYRTGRKRFTNHVIQLKPGDLFYLFSDGYYDQFGGEFDKKYMRKKFDKMLAFTGEQHIDDQIYILRYEFHLWKEMKEQVDDVSVAGFRIPEAA
jgi:serine phosphatase RsbU (regulator of sigma subunit)